MFLIQISQINIFDRNSGRFFLIIEFDKFSKNFINAGSSIILLLILIPFMESFSDFSYQIFNISFVFVLDFFEYSSIFLIFLYYIVFFFIQDNFIHSSSQFDNSSVNDLVESSYSNLTLPFLPFSDKNLITLNIAYCLAIAFFTFLGINIVRSFLVAWYFFSDQYFYDHSYSLYFVYAFFIVFFEILWIYRFGKQLFIRNRDRSQREYNSWLNERNKMFSDLKEGIVNTKVSDPVSYLPSMINQYYEEKNKRSLAKVIKIAFGISFFFTIIFFLTNKFTLQELLMLFSVFFIIFFLMGIIPDKASSEIYRTMIDAALSNNIPVFVSEIVKYESNHKKINKI